MTVIWLLIDSLTAEKPLYNIIREPLEGDVKYLIMELQLPKLVCLHNFCDDQSRLMMSLEAKKQHACLPLSLHSYYSELFTCMTALKFANATAMVQQKLSFRYYRPNTFLLGHLKS